MWKSSLRKAGLWLMAFCVIFASWAAPAAAAFGDTGGHWAQQAIDTWHNHGVVNGFEGQFRPDDAVTRGEFAVMVDNIMKYQVEGEHGFSDLPDGKWYSGPIARLHAAGVLSGSDGKARPEQNITRQEAALILTRAFGLERFAGQARAEFADVGDIASWAADAVGALAHLGVLNGYPDGTFRPGRDISRAEAVIMFDRLVADLIGEPGEYERDTDGNLVVNTPDVTLKNMTITGDLYIAQGVGDGDVTLDNVTIEGSVHVNGGGDNTIIFNSVRVSGALIVKKFDNKVRILATGNTSVSVTVLESGAMLVTRELSGGGFETVEISADVAAGQEIVLEGDFGKVVNRSSEANIAATGSIGELVSEANTNISGDVRIETVTVTSDDVEVKVNDETAAPGAPAGTPPAGGTPGGSTGGTPGGGSSPGGGSTSPKLTGVSLEKTFIQLYVGETFQARVIPEPANAKLPNMTWRVDDNSENVITVDQNGLITAVGEGDKTVFVELDDEHSTILPLIVSVRKPPIVMEISVFDETWAAEDFPYDENLLENGSQLAIVENGYTKLGNFPRGWTIKAQDSLKSTVVNGVYGNLAPVVITLVDHNGQPLEDLDGMTVSYHAFGGMKQVTTFGEGLAGPLKDASFLLPIQAGDPETRHLFMLTASKAGMADGLLTIEYLPQGMPVITGLEPIQGEPKVGEVLTGGDLIYGGDASGLNIEYGWVFSQNKDSGYFHRQPTGALTTYTVTKEDIGYYIRLFALSLDSNVGGVVLSDPIGPILPPYTEEEFLAALDAHMLGDNTGPSEITRDLRLTPAIPGFDGTTITWSSGKPAVISDSGQVFRDTVQDQKVLLYAIYSGVVTGMKTYELTVKFQPYMDPYFAEEPRAYVDETTGTVWVEYELKQAAEVFMTIYRYGRDGMVRDVQSVLDGHAGNQSSITTATDWPYFPADPAKLSNTFDTEETVYPNYDFRIDFVIRDKDNNYLSERLTTLNLEGEELGGNDEDIYPPYLTFAHINADRDAIYLHFDEVLDDRLVPKKEDFTLNNGTIEQVSIHHYPYDYALPPGYIKLSVKDVQAGPVTVSYHGTDIRDEAGNAATITNVQVMDAEPSMEAILSYDRKVMTLHITPGWPSDPSKPPVMNEITVTVGGQTFHPNDWFSRYISYGIMDSEPYSHMIIQAAFRDPLPAGDVDISYKTAGQVTWAQDPYPAELTVSGVAVSVAPGTPASAEYDQTSKRLVLTFNDGFEFDYATFAGGLILKADGKDLPLRGSIVSTSYWEEEKNKLYINLNDKYSGHYAQAVEDALANGKTVTIRYEKKYGNDLNQIRDAMGVLLPDFPEITVTAK